MTHPGRPTAFEDLVEDYDAARPTYPQALYDEIGALGDCLELGAGTGIASVELAKRGNLTVTDLGPKMLAKGLPKHGRPGVVCRAEALPFRDNAFDTVCGAQMWHWVDKALAPAEAARVLRPDGHLCIWWNEAASMGQPWFERQEDLIEAANPLYRRGYRVRDRAAELREAGWVGDIRSWTTTWQRVLDVPLYERWLRSKSYVQASGDVDRLVAGVREALLVDFPDGVVTEAFTVHLWTARRQG